jgi:diketogulonate reductase-like aldo/keto reductase
LPSLKVKPGREEMVSVVLEKIAASKNTLLTSVALAYVIHKQPYVFPLVGGRKVSHLEGNIEALGLALSKEEIEEIEHAYDFDIGFPHNLLSGSTAPRGPEDINLTEIRGTFDYIEGIKPIGQ